MSLRKNIEDKLQNALKQKDKILSSTLRLILAAIKDKDIASRSKDNREGIKDEDIKQLLKKMIKQRNESIEIYKNNNRNDLLELEEKEVSIISEFLPKQLDEKETLDICKNTINSLGANSIKDMGKVMGALKKDYAEVLDFAKAGTILKEILK
jgi:uncharacterized protein YqeY|tara:strand:- start:3148 stop:3606 length:459 start_codon:yes stop_codon:yes gene_type:complete